MTPAILPIADSVRAFQRSSLQNLLTPVNLESLAPKVSLKASDELARAIAFNATSTRAQSNAAQENAGFMANLALAGAKAMFPYQKAFQDAALNSGTYDTAQRTGAQMGSAAANSLAGTAAQLAAGLFGRQK